MRSLLVASLFVAAASAQPVPDSTAHRVPFASTGNTLELAVANTGADEALDGVIVRLMKQPDWLAVAPETVALDALAPGAEALAAFTFAVDPQAPVGQPAEVAFAVESPDGRRWTRRFRLEVEAPRRFALAPASPNPFGGQATLAFELPEASRVTLSVYDVLGREIARPADGDQEPGRHTVVFDARHLASGVYVARIVAETADGRRTVRTQRMTRVR